MATRINKYLSEVGYCSRRAADRLIEEGKVTINGEISEMGTKVKEEDQVEVEGQIIEKLTNTKKIYLAFHKPVGIVCTTDRRVEPDNIIDFIKYPKRIFPIGRLDKSSEGLIFLTNDGDIVNKILRARNNHEKEYIVTVNRQIRRMCEALGYRVQSLKRVRIMNINLDIPKGKYREFTKGELFELNRLLENSQKHFTNHK